MGKDKVKKCPRCGYNLPQSNVLRCPRCNMSLLIKCMDCKGCSPSLFIHYKKKPSLGFKYVKD